MKRIGLITIFWITYTLLFAQGGSGTYYPFDLEVDGVKREYKLYVPEGHDGSEAWPLVFNFHWGNGSVIDQIKISQMYLVADTAKFLIVYPLGFEIYFRPLKEKFIGWNIPDNSIGTQDDVLFVNKIIDDIISNPSFNIDLRRIHATGLCGGGMFSHYLAFKLSNRIASVASVVGPMSDTLIKYICNPVRKISVLHMQGTNDPVLHEIKEWFLPLRGSTDCWADVNGCNAISDSTQLENIDLTDNSTVTLFDYTGCDQETEVKLYRINGGGHTWSGGWIDPDWIPIVGVVNKDINASVEIWNFFKRNPHPNPWVEIPNKAFLHALIDEGVDTNGDSLISYVEAEAVTSLYVNHHWPPFNGGITSLEGIQAFINLDTLECFNQSLTSLDLSKNTALKFLWCEANPLTSLDLSNNTALRAVDCSHNQLTSLDVSNCIELEILYCVDSKLPDLNVEENTRLSSLTCRMNNLTYLNISNNPEIVHLDISCMPTLSEVCVWTDPFPPEGVFVDTLESPNVYFTSDCKVTDLNSYKDESEILIFPNPSNDIINIVVDNTNKATVEIYSLNGKFLINKAVNSKVEEIDISGLTKGMYFIKVRQENNVRIEKLIVY